MSDSLIHLIYASAANHPFSDDELILLLEKARTHNAEQGITGMLLHCHGSFFQILEGPESRIKNLYNVISKDLRHSKITLIIQEPIFERSFGDWSMGFTGASESQLETIDGLADFFQSGSCLADIDHGRAKKLLKAFASGSWRSKLA